MKGNAKMKDRRKSADGTAEAKPKRVGKRKRTRHGQYKIGTVKITVTVDNEDDVRSKRKAKRMGYKDRSDWLRETIHQAVWDEPLTAEDYDTLKEMLRKQEES